MLGSAEAFFFSVHIHIIYGRRSPSEYMSLCPAVVATACSLPSRHGPGSSLLQESSQQEVDLWRYFLEVLLGAPLCARLLVLFPLCGVFTHLAKRGLCGSNAVLVSVVNDMLLKVILGINDTITSLVLKTVLM